MKKNLCECGCGRYAKPGKRFIFGHHRRLPHRLGVTHSNKAGREWKTFDAGKEIGTISVEGSRLKIYDTFFSPQEALDWWAGNRKSYMKEVYKEYLKEVKNHKGKFDIQDFVRVGDRPQIFWELEFGVSYPSNEDKLLLLESHSLWWPGERNMILAEGKVIPKVKSKACLLHSFGHPIKWPFEPAVKIENGELYFCDCQATKAIRWNKL